MVAKISHGTSLYGALAYNYGKVAAGTAEILSGNRMISDRLGLPGTDMRLALLSFENYLLANRNTEKPVLHIALSPAPEDRLTDVQLFTNCFAYEKLYCILDSHLPSFNRLHQTATENGNERIFYPPNGHFPCSGGFNHIVIFQCEDFRQRNPCHIKRTA